MCQRRVNLDPLATAENGPPRGWGWLVIGRGHRGAGVGWSRRRLPGDGGKRPGGRRDCRSVAGCRRGAGWWNRPATPVTIWRSQTGQTKPVRASPAGVGGKASRIRGVRSGGDAAEVAVFEPVAVAFEIENFGVLHEPVDHGGGDDLVAEHLAPAAEGLVAGDD